MSKDTDLECDSPISRHELNETKDEMNLDEPVGGHCLYENRDYKVELS